MFVLFCFCYAGIFFSFGRESSFMLLFYLFSVVILSGMDWVAENAILPAVATLSPGSIASRALNNAVNRLDDASIVVVVPAGNQQQNACNRFSAPVVSLIMKDFSTSRVSYYSLATH